MLLLLSFDDCVYVHPIQKVQLDEEVQSLRCEREHLPSEKPEGACDHDEVENLHATLTSVTEERNQLQEILQGLREEHSQLKRDLEESNDMVMLGITKKHDCEVSVDGRPDEVFFSSYRCRRSRCRVRSVHKKQPRVCKTNFSK